MGACRVVFKEGRMKVYVMSRAERLLSAWWSSRMPSTSIPCLIWRDGQMGMLFASSCPWDWNHCKVTFLFSEMRDALLPLPSLVLFLCRTSPLCHCMCVCKEQKAIGNLQCAIPYHTIPYRYWLVVQRDKEIEAYTGAWKMKKRIGIGWLFGWWFLWLISRLILFCCERKTLKADRFKRRG